jgi:hypothetical protein
MRGTVPKNSGAPVTGAKPREWGATQPERTNMHIDELLTEIDIDKTEVDGEVARKAIELGGKLDSWPTMLEVPITTGALGGGAAAG